MLEIRPLKIKCVTSVSCNPSFTGITRAKKCLRRRRKNKVFQLYQLYPWCQLYLIPSTPGAFWRRAHLAGAAELVLTSLLVRELGGKRFAQGLAALAGRSGAGISQL
jgi:hypothetical protein